MKNRAKCKLCQSIIESFHRYDYVNCACQEIAISGGRDLYEVYAKSFENFLRIDDLDNEIMVKEQKEFKEVYSDPKDVKQLYNENPTREDKIKMLDEMIKTYESLPANALNAPITGYDLLSSLLLVSSILRS